MARGDSGAGALGRVDYGGSGMFRIRVQGRRGGEVLATAGLLAAAVTTEGRRAAVAAAAMDGPAVALCTADGWAAASVDGPPPVADALIVADPSELGRPDIFARLSPEAYLLVNSTCGFGDLGVSDRVERFYRDRALVLPAARLDLGRHDGLIRSAALLGGFAALSRMVSLDGVIAAVQDRMPQSAAWAGVEAAGAGYDFVRAARQALAV